MNPEKMPYWPAALRLDLAAAYCGLSPETFKKVCPVQPIPFTESSRGHRYLRAKIDAWLVSLDPNQPPSLARYFGERINARSSDDEPPRRRRRRKGDTQP